MSASCSHGRLHVALSKEIICFSFNLFVYLCPSTILQACLKNITYLTVTANENHNCRPVEMGKFRLNVPPWANNWASFDSLLEDMEDDHT